MNAAAQPGQELTLDPVAAYRSGQDVVAAVARRDWSRLAWILGQVDPYERVGLVVLAGSEPGASSLAAEQLSRQPGDAVAAAVLGAARTTEAWDIRTALRTEHVSRDQFAAFHELLQQADLGLTEALLRAPDEPALWAAGLPIARGLELGPSEAEHRYRQVARLLPGLRNAQAQYLQYLCPKWFGSWELADAFAESCARESPPGSFGAVTLAEVAIEYVLDQPAKAPKDWLRILPGTGWPQRIRQAADWSVFHPQFQPRYGWVRVLHTFALAFCLAGSPGDARAVLDRCGPYGSESPWNYFGDPATLIGRARQGKPLLGRR